MRVLILLMVLIPEIVSAKMAPILQSPRFDPNRITIISTLIAIINGMTVIRVENLETGCVFTVIRETGSVIAANDRC